MTDTRGGENVHEQSETEIGVHDSPNPDAAPGQSSASDWDMDRTKPSGDSGRKPQTGEPLEKKAPPQPAPRKRNR